MDRRLRLSCKGTLHIEIDFRPKYFLAQDPMGGGGDPADEPRTPRESDLLDADEEKKEPVKDSHGLILVKPEAQDIVDPLAGGRAIVGQDPVEMYRRFKKVDMWA